MTNPSPLLVVSTPSCALQIYRALPSKLPDEDYVEEAYTPPKEIFNLAKIPGGVEIATLSLDSAPAPSTTPGQVVCTKIISKGVSHFYEGPVAAIM